MERCRVFALEGLDGTGKSTAGKLIAEKSDSQYLYSGDKNLLRGLRHRFDNASPTARFIYYTLFGLDTYFRVEQMRKESDVFVDRTILSTIAYHRALGLSNNWFRLVPKFAVNQFDLMLLFKLEEESRRKLLVARSQETGEALKPSDRKSIELAQKIEEAYRQIMPGKTFEVPVILGNPQATAELVIGRINER